MCFIPQVVSTMPAGAAAVDGVPLVVVYGVAAMAVVGVLVAVVYGAVVGDVTSCVVNTGEALFQHPISSGEISKFYSLYFLLYITSG